eukprot:scaffold25597_cov206-Cylindrotheca_fusiformis.AAC.4
MDLDEGPEGASTMGHTMEVHQKAETIDNVKATKGDDATVQVKLWDQRLCRVLGIALTDKVQAAAEVLRKWLLSSHVRRTARSFFGWLHQRPNFKQCGISMSRVVELSRVLDKKGPVAPTCYEWTPTGKTYYVDWWEARFKAHRKDLAAGRDVILRLARSTWWNWDDGSRPAHWKWPSWYLEVIRDGLQVWFKRSPNFWKRPQPKGRDAKQHELIKKKLGKVRERRYVVAGTVDSLTSFFAVPKGEDDIRMVYDGTKSGLNDSIWVPRFSLPTVNSMLRAVDSKTFMADFDIGECFLNFILHESMQALCGIDLTHFFGEDSKGKRKVLWERWARAAMGLKSSPYQAVQAVLVAKDK